MKSILSTHGRNLTMPLPKSRNPSNASKKIKEALLLSEKHLGHANHKLQDVTVRKLTYNNPTMKQKFEEARQGETVTELPTNEQ